MTTVFFLLWYLKCINFKTRLESYNDPRPSTNQSTSFKRGLIFDRFVLFCTYVRTDTITRNNESLFKLVLWFVLGRGSILICFTIFHLSLLYRSKYTTRKVTPQIYYLIAPEFQLITYFSWFYFSPNGFDLHQVLLYFELFKVGKVCFENNLEVSLLSAVTNFWPTKPRPNG